MGVLKIVHSFKRHSVFIAETNVEASLGRNKFTFSNNSRLILKNNEGYKVLTYSDIRFLKSASNYTYFSLMNGATEIECKTLGHFEQRLDERFVRVHKSFIVNLMNVLSYNEKRSEIIMDDESIVPVSRRRKAELKSYLDGN